jgi:hypothetical protein
MWTEVCAKQMQFPEKKFKIYRTKYRSSGYKRRPCAF